MHISICSRLSSIGLRDIWSEIIISKLTPDELLSVTTLEITRRLEER